ncbi:10 kDa chaperonin [Rhizophlyctis rosea]|uniref:10 kDa chaperonin n=1 Tax=Rhizophlyctis rosea TaxID=64517 RepID=A0AAD5X4U8_9FUNG|nr:10 kDa chaperonin [Rhizophlyctis rosea]
MSSSVSKRIIPLLDRVLVQRVKAAERTKSGLFIPEKAQENQNEGIVVAVGPGARGKDGQVQPVSVKEGERVLLPQYGGSTVKLDGNEYLLLKDEELLAKFL